MAGFIVDAAEAARLAAQIAANRAALLPVIRSETVKAGQQIQALARAGAPRGPHTKGFAAGFATKTRQLADGTEVTIENKSQLGAIIVFGTSTSGPHDSPGAALASVYPSWEAAIMAAAARVI